jgi:glycosyltransferase involved in cell wall biosynthesis
MKILMITMDYFGGILHYTSQLSNALSKKVDVAVITPKDADRSLFDKSVKVISIPVGDTKMNFVINTLLATRMFNFLRVVREEEPDVIHFQNAYNLWASTFLPLLGKYKIVTTLHDVEPHLGYQRFDKMIARSLHFKYSHCFIVHCRKEKEKLVALGIKKKSYIIPHGDYSFFTKYCKEGIKERDIVLFFGHITPYKGLEYLLKATPLITKKLPNVRIIIAGKGDLKRYADLITTPNVKVYNRFIPNQKVAELFQMAKVIVLPYVEATQSGIIPIAYAFKKPVVTTNVGCIPEIIDNGKTGLLVPPKNVDALAKAIIKLLKDDELRKEIGANAYLKIKEELSWDKISEKTVEVYKKVIANGNTDK